LIKTALARHLRLKLVPDGALCFRMLRYVSSSRIELRVHRKPLFGKKARHIRVNVPSLDPIQTPGLDVFANDDVKNFLTLQVPLGRIGTADEVARTAPFLPPTIPAMWPASNCSSMADRRRSE
jgi:hypothetical protein